MLIFNYYLVELWEFSIYGNIVFLFSVMLYVIVFIIVLLFKILFEIIIIFLKLVIFNC